MMYVEAITWKANSSGSEDNHGSNGSTPGVDELMFENIRSLKRHLKP